MSDSDPSEPTSSKTPTRKRGSVFSWLSAETIRTANVTALNDWRERVIKSRNPPPGTESLEAVVAAAFKARDATEPLAMFADIVGKGERSWIRDSDWESAKQAVRAWREADACPELSALTSGLFGGADA